jgi:two-component system, OmpR family, KDP operon response regulator KdpE
VSTVLVVDDDPALVRALGINLRARGYDVRAADTGVAALRLAASHPPDAVVLDLGLPDMDGSEVIAGLRGWTDVPILVLSAREQSRQKVAALDAGADDYIVKPFGMDELLARLRAAIRRGAPAPAEPTVTTEDFTIDLSAGRVTAGGTDVKLTPTEWHLLEVLARHPGKVIDHGRLLTEVWGPAYREQTNYLRVYIAALRRKLEPDAANPRHLLTEPGRGYRFEP